MTVNEQLRRLQLEHKCTREHAIRLLVSRHRIIPYGMSAPVVDELGLAKGTRG
jgi:hypothetical protein